MKKKHTKHKEPEINKPEKVDSKTEIINPDKPNRKFKLVGIILLSIVGAMLLFFCWYQLVYVNKIYHNVKIGNTDFTGLTVDDAQKLLDKKIIDNSNGEISVSLGSDSWKLKPSEIDLNYNKEKTLENLYAVGRDQGFWQNIKTRFGLLFKAKNIESVYSYDGQKLTNFWTNIIAGKEKYPINASFTYDNNKIGISKEENGSLIDKVGAKNNLDELFAVINLSGSITLIMEIVEPKISANLLESLKGEMTNVVISPIILESEIKNIEINTDQIFSWTDIVAVSSQDNSKKVGFIETVKANEKDVIYSPEIIINEEKIKSYLHSISSEINKESKDAKLEFKDGKATIFQTAQKGYELDIDKNTINISDLLDSRLSEATISPEESNLVLIVRVTEPKINDSNIDSLGIKELIATGSTSFAGSPSNRIHNITVGAQGFNGVVIKPGETLSAIGIIGNPSAETGYLPELVIKENKTIPEYGGGLCQVSTTLFRAALNAGLEILARTNHMYRVSYYEPPVGMDATVYYPEPDLIIKNNTPAHILVQTSVSGNTITFDLYGTKDNRQVEITDPTILATFNPPDPLYTESLSLPSGTIQKLESAHPGAKTMFYYKVTNNGQVLTEQTFNSYYTAWQAKYLYGPGTPDIPGKSNPAPSESPSSN